MLTILLSVFLVSTHPAQHAGFSPESTGNNSNCLLQTEPTTIAGKISDTKGDPLMYASVFISNTTLGTTSNEYGEYQLNNVPYGAHKLVASYVGYESKVISIHVNKASIIRNVQLVKNPMEIEEVMVLDKKSKNRWKQNFKKFKKGFIGVSDNAHVCNITNPKTLLFHRDKESGDLIAKAGEPLVIENYGLGYTIHFVLEKFVLQRGGICTYTGSAFFIPMNTEKTSMAELWKTNRKRAYYGSVQHFLRSLTNNRTVEQGFIVQSCPSMVPVEDKKEVEKILIHHRNPQDSEIIVFPGNFTYERRFLFNNILHVAFTKESESHAYGATRDPSYRLKTFQQSWIRLRKENALFNTLGYLNDPESAIFNGYWAFERQSEALPDDYYPED